MNWFNRTIEPDARIRQTAEQLIQFVESGIGQLTHIDSAIKMLTLPQKSSTETTALYSLLKQIDSFEQLPDLAQKLKNIMGLGKLNLSYWKQRENID